MSRTHKDKPWRHWTPEEERRQYTYAKHYWLDEGAHVYWRYSRLNGGCVCGQEGSNTTRVPRCLCLEPCECRATLESRLDYDCRHRAWPKYRYVRWREEGR